MSEDMPARKRVEFLVSIILPAVVLLQPVFAQYDADYVPSGEESVEGCPRLEGDQAGLGPPGDAGDIRKYRRYDSKEFDEMRGDAGLNQAKQVKGAWCGQVKSDPIQLQEDAGYHLRQTEFCQERRWKFDQQMNYNFNSNKDANFRIPFAEEMARQWGGIWDAEHETEQTIDTKERIRAGGSPTQPLTNIEEAIRGQVATEIENKTGVVKMLTSLAEQDELKEKFITYVKQKADKSMYANFAVNGTRLVDIRLPPKGADGKVDYASSAYKTWYEQWGKTWDKLGLFPNERTTGEFKFDVCDDQRYTWWYGYPEVMKMTLAANKIFQRLQPKQIQDQMYTDKFTDLRDPLTSSQLVGDFFSAAPSQNTPQDTQTVVQDVSQASPNFWQGAIQSLTSFLGHLGASVKQVFAQQTSPVVGGNVIGSSCISVSTQVVSTTNTSDGGADVVIQPTVTSLNGKSGHIQYFINGKSQATQWPFDTRKGRTFNPPQVTIHITPGQSMQEVSFGVKMDECGDAGNAAGTCGLYMKDANGQLIQQSCDQAGPPPPNKPPEEKPVRDQCNGETCLHETTYCKLGCAICQRAQLGPSDTEMTGNWYKGNHMYYGQTQTSRPVQWTWKTEVYTDTSYCAKDKGSIESRCGLPGCYPLCPPEAEKQCGIPNPPPDYDIHKGNSHGRTVSLYNNVPFLEAAWKLVAGNYNAAETGFLHAFTIDSIKGQGNTNAQGCTSDPNVVFDSAGNFVPLPGASWAFWSGVQLPKPNKATNDRPQFGADTEPTVKQTVPSADDGRAKILFYRLGGLCNANKWVSGKELLPNNLQQVLNTTTNPFFPTSPYTTPAPTPAPSSPGTQSTFAEGQTVGQKLAGIDQTLPAGEVPNVTTVTNPAALSSQPLFSGIQVNDQIAVYSQAGKVVIYRPQTNTIVSKTNVIKVSLRNGTSQDSLFQAFVQDLTLHSPNIIVTERKAAAKSDYTKPVLIDPTGTKKAQAATLAVGLGVSLADLPEGERVPEGVDFLIIYGGPQVAIRNGTTFASALASFQATVTQTIPTATVVSTGNALQTNFATTAITDPSGKRIAEGTATANILGIRYVTSFSGEPAPAGNVFLIIIGADKISSQ